MTKRTTEREIDENSENENNENKMDQNTEYKDDNNDNDERMEEERMQTMNIYVMKDSTVGIMQKMNIKLPSPTQFDGRYPQFYEWAGEVKAYLSFHSVNIEDIMDDCSKSVTVIS
eukprot:2943284-Amphidinium_carterae.1